MGDDWRCGAAFDRLRTRAVPGQFRVDVPVRGVVIDRLTRTTTRPRTASAAGTANGAGASHHRGGGRPWERRHVEADHHDAIMGATSGTKGIGEADLLRIQLTL